MRTRTTDVVEEWAAVRSSHDPDRFAAMPTDDCEYEDLGSGWRAAASTRRARRPRGPARDRPGGTVRGTSMMELRDGEIGRCTDCWNLVELLRQLGVMD